MIAAIYAGARAWVHSTHVCVWVHSKLLLRVAIFSTERQRRFPAHVTPGGNVLSNDAARHGRGNKDRRLHGRLPGDIFHSEQLELWAGALRFGLEFGSHTRERPRRASALETSQESRHFLTLYFSFPHVLFLYYYALLRL